MAVPVLGSLLKVPGLAAFFRGLTSWALKWVGPIFLQGLAFLGISMVVADWGIGPIIQQMQQAFSGAPQVFVQIVAYVNGDVAMSMILSAYVVRASGRLVFQRSGG